MGATKKTRAPVSESMEHYLLAILRLSAEAGVARIRDISQAVAVSPASATNGVNALVQAGFAAHETYGYVQLTPNGKRIANKVLRRREVLLRFLTEVLEVDAKAAETDACGMEHCLSEKTLGRLVRFLEFMGLDGKNVNTRCLTQLRSFLHDGQALDCPGCEVTETGRRFL